MEKEWLKNDNIVEINAQYSAYDRFYYLNVWCSNSFGFCEDIFTTL